MPLLPLHVITDSIVILMNGIRIVLASNTYQIGKDISIHSYSFLQLNREKSNQFLERCRISCRCRVSHSQIVWIRVILVAWYALIRWMHAFSATKLSKNSIVKKKTRGINRSFARFFLYRNKNTRIPPSNNCSWESAHFHRCICILFFVFRLKLCY